MLTANRFSGSNLGWGGLLPPTTGVPATPAPTFDAAEAEKRYNVSQLQHALKKYAELSGNSATNPGRTDGIVDLQTAQAVFAMAPLIPHLPDDVKKVLVAAKALLLVPGVQSTVFDQISAQAKYISYGILSIAAVATAFGAGGSASPSSGGGGGGPTATPWWQTPKGVAMIAGGVIATGLVLIVGARALSR